MTKLEFCNRALAVIGHDRKIVSLDDSTTEAMRANEFFPAAYRNVLAAYNWDFATTVVTFVKENEGDKWTIPSSAVKIVTITDENGHSLNAKRRGNSIVIVGANKAEISYISASDIMIGAMPHLVAEAVVYELAALLFGPMIGNVQDSQGNALYQSYVAMAAAKLQAAIQAEDAEHAFLGGSRGGSTVSKTDIVNLALARLGSTTTISDFDSDSSPIAARARLLWAPTWRDLLVKRDWDFASEERKMNVCGVSTEEGYNRVPLPGDFLKLVSVTDSRGASINVKRNSRELFVEVSEGEITLRYIADFGLEDATEDFIDLFTLALASRLAPSILDNANAVELIERKFQLALGDACYREANETAPQGEWKNPLITCRR